MGHPNYNPPSDVCPECLCLSEIYFIGSRTVTNEDGSLTKITRYECQHKHSWKVEE